MQVYIFSQSSGLSICKAISDSYVFFCIYHSTAFSKMEPSRGSSQELAVSDLGLKEISEGLKVLSGTRLQVPCPQASKVSVLQLCSTMKDGCYHRQDQSYCFMIFSTFSGWANVKNSVESRPTNISYLNKVCDILDDSCLSPICFVLQIIHTVTQSHMQCWESTIDCIMQYPARRC